MARPSSTFNRPVKFRPTGEQLLCAALDGESATRVLCSAVRGPAVLAALERWPAARIVCHTLDLYPSARLRAAVPEQVGVVCTPDLPVEPIDLFLFAFHKGDDAELTRDLLQQAHERLEVGGRIVLATDHAKDGWLHEDLQRLFGKVTRKVVDGGIVFRATKTGPFKKLKSFEAEYAFRDDGRLIHGVTRPGVFSHRRVDGGARELIRALVIPRRAKVLDIGCGSGSVAFAAAFRADEVQVVALDSHSRAIECTQRGAALNRLANVTTVWNSEGETGAAGTFDYALANPPYYSNFRIAELFLDTALRALKRGGEVLVVTKTPSWFAESMPARFRGVTLEPGTHYTVVRAQKP